ncbi:MAG: hypothetical protein ACREO2_05920, partial [Arenimonas sp.]
MKRIVFALMLLINFAASAATQRIEIAGSSASFEQPAGFTALTIEEIEDKYPKENGPSLVVGNESRATTIAYTLKDIAITEAQLPEMLAPLTDYMQTELPSIKWIERKMIDFQGQKWIYLEMTSEAIDTDIHNIMLITALEGKMLFFNFNSTREEFPLIEESLRQS